MWFPSCMLGPKYDPSGAAHIAHWVESLRTLDPLQPPRMVSQRMLHPGLRAVSGAGLVSAVPLGKVLSPGRMAMSVSLLRFLDESPANEDQVEDLEVSGSTLGGLFTLVSNRLCEVIPEIPPGGVGGVMTPLPIAGAIDSQLGAPMPEWEEVDSDFRDLLARLTSLPKKASTAVSAAIHLHYCASLLLTRDRTGAYALVVAGIETLAMTFGEPPKAWANWDQSDKWDALFVDLELSEEQSKAIRDRLVRDKHMRLADTFANYAVKTLPEGFWDEEVSDYVWGVAAESGEYLEGEWMPARRRDPRFGADPDLAKKAFKKAYQVRSKFMHAGQRTVTLADDTFGEAPGRERTVLSFAQARATLRRLIQVELATRGSTDPAGLEELVIASLQK